MKACLTVNGVSVELGYQDLEIIAGILPDIEENSKIFHQLSLSESSEIRAAVAAKENLSAETAELLLRDGSIIVLCEVLKTDIGKACLTKETILRFVELDSMRLMKTIVIELDDIVNEFEVCPVDYIVDLLIQCSDPGILNELAGCDFIGEEYLKMLTEGPYNLTVKRTARRTLEELE